MILELKRKLASLEKRAKPYHRRVNNHLERVKSNRINKSLKRIKVGRVLINLGLK